jgi:putative phosphoribosyl transferase
LGCLLLPVPRERLRQFLTGFKSVIEHSNLPCFSPFAAEVPAILALPRGGVPVAAEIASALDAPLDLVLVRKIGVPFQPELAMGAVVDGDAPLIVRNEDVIESAGIGETEFKTLCDRELAEIERRRRKYLGRRERVDVARRTAIIVDDGNATGATMRAALRATRMRNPKWLVLAVPVGPTDSVAAMRGGGRRRRVS